MSCSFITKTTSLREAIGLLPLGGTKWSGWAKDILLQAPALEQIMTVKQVMLQGL